MLLNYNAMLVNRTIEWVLDSTNQYLNEEIAKNRPTFAYKEPTHGFAVADDFMKRKTKRMFCYLTEYYLTIFFSSKQIKKKL